MVLCLETNLSTSEATSQVAQLSIFSFGGRGWPEATRVEEHTMRENHTNTFFVRGNREARPALEEF